MSVPEMESEHMSSEYWNGSAKGEMFIGCFGFFIVLIVLIAVIHDYTQPRAATPCDAPKSITCLDQRVQECMALDKYSKDQCVTLVGGNK